MTTKKLAPSGLARTGKGVAAPRVPFGQPVIWTWRPRLVDDAFGAAYFVIRSSIPIINRINPSRAKAQLF